MKNNSKIDGLERVVFVNGWPFGLVKNVTLGNITSINDSTPTHYTVGNSGGPIYIFRDGKIELAGISTKPYKNLI